PKRPKRSGRRGQRPKRAEEEGRRGQPDGSSWRNGRTCRSAPTCWRIRVLRAHFSQNAGKSSPCHTGTGLSRQRSGGQSPNSFSLGHPVNPVPPPFHLQNVKRANLLKRSDTFACFAKRARQRLTSKTSPEAGAVSYTYNSDGTVAT